MTEPSGDPAERRAGIKEGLSIALVMAFGLVVLALPVYALMKSGGPEPDAAMTMGNIGGEPVELDTLQPALAAMYRGAEEHGEHLTNIPCFCGCEEGRLQHRHLLDCFVLKDGRGWESHAVGCDVCQGEARMALRLLDQGTPVDEVRERIIDRFGMPEEMRELQEG